MSQAEDLLNSLSENEIPTNMLTPGDEPHIIINSDRTILIPDSLKRIGVQFDHNAETVTFDCPRYWDEHDLLDTNIDIVYKRADGKSGYCKAGNISVDEENDQIMHFIWRITNNVTAKAGGIEFLICAKKTNSIGEEELHWNSELCKDAYISEGLKCIKIPTVDATAILGKAIIGKMKLA